MSISQLLSVSQSKPEGDAKAKGAGSGSNSPWRVTMKEYTKWHSKVSNVVVFFVLLGIGGILGLTATLNAAGYYANPESGFLSTSLTSFPPTFSTSNSSFALDSSSSLPTPEPQQLGDKVDITELRSNNIIQSDTSSDSNFTFSTDEPYEERQEMYHGNSSDYLLPNPVNLENLSDAHHGMSDEELLGCASAMAASARPATVTPKVAFLFLTRGPLPLAPLWERYFRGNRHLYSIYVHAHPHYLPNVSADSVFFRRNIPSKEVQWGRLSVFAAERRLLANALLDPSNERFVLLSESCIPIAPLPVAHKYYMESEHSFVHVFIDQGRGGLGRYNRIKNHNKLNPEISAKQWRKGSQWFEMSRELALTVVSDHKYYPKFQNVFCKGSGVCYIDEHYLPTVLTTLAPTKLANRTTHFIDFHRSTPHPYQWEAGVINEGRLRLITEGHNCTYNGRFTTTCHMFARKFSPGTLEPLLKLASTSFGIP